METIINKLYDQQDLSQQESQQLFDTIIKGELDPIFDVCRVDRSENQR